MSLSKHLANAVRLEGLEGVERLPSKQAVRLALRRASKAKSGMKCCKLQYETKGGLSCPTHGEA